MRRAVATNVCGRKSSCELVRLTITHVQVVYRGSGDNSLPHPLFLKKEWRYPIATGKLARYSSSLFQ